MLPVQHGSRWAPCSELAAAGCNETGELSFYGAPVILENEACLAAVTTVIGTQMAEWYVQNMWRQQRIGVLEYALSLFHTKPLL